MIRISSVSTICRTKSIERNGKVRLEAAPINRIHIVGRALINASIHLGRRIDFDFRFYLIIADAPLMHLFSPNQLEWIISKSVLKPTRSDDLRAYIDADRSLRHPLAM